LAIYSDFSFRMLTFSLGKGVKVGKTLISGEGEQVEVTAFRR